MSRRNYQAINQQVFLYIGDADFAPITDTAADLVTAIGSLWLHKLGGSPIEIELTAKSAVGDAHTDGHIWKIADGQFALDAPDSLCSTITAGVQILSTDADYNVEIKGGPIDVVVEQTGDSYAIVNSGTYGLSALKTLIDAIKAITDTLTPSGIRGFLGLASANLDTQLSTIYDEVEAKAEPSDIPTVEEIDEELTDNHGAGSWQAPSAGSGANAVTITVDDGDDPVEGAIVRVTKGAETFAQTTDADGEVAFSLDAGTWTVSITASGFDSFTPASLVVAGATTATYSLDALTLTPSDPGAVTGFATTYDEAGAPESGATVYCKPAAAAGTGVLHDATVRTATSDGDGLVEFANLLPGWSYLLWRGTAEPPRYKRVDIPSDATGSYELPSLIGE